MNPNFRTVIQASDDERRGLFLTTTTRLGTAIQNVEKDFWVCWVLDALFNGLPPGGPRLLFKGGTSLSKSFGLISRFSEDIDVTVFRQDIGEPIETSELDALSGKQRRIRLDRIRAACHRYIAEVMAVQLKEIAAGASLSTASVWNWTLTIPTSRRYCFGIPLWRLHQVTTYVPP